MNPVLAYTLRCVGTGLFVANATLVTATAAGTALDAHQITIAVLAGIQGALLYAGLGAAVPQIEPKIGNKITAAK